MSANVRTVKQKIDFAKYYLEHGKPALAAEMVGHKPGGASVRAGSRYLKDKTVIEHLEKAKAKVADDYGISKQSLIDELVKIATKEAVIDGIKCYEKATDRVKAVSELNKMLGFHAPIKTEGKFEVSKGVIIVPDNGGVYE
jgi:hypothetical protein